MAKRGRPKANIDLDMVRKMAHIHCTQEEIAQVLDVSVRTLHRNKEFKQVYKKALEEGKASLRRLQWRKAEDGDKGMLIFLGKQYLGQSDHTDMRHSGDIGVTIIDDIK